MVHEVHAEGSQLENELSVVGVGAAVLPWPVVMHVPEVDDIPTAGEEGGGMKGEAVRERVNKEESQGGGG